MKKGKKEKNVSWLANKKFPKSKICKFCKNSGRKPKEFRSHTLKDENENLTCPVLR